MLFKSEFFWILSFGSLKTGPEERNCPQRPNSFSHLRPVKHWFHNFNYIVNFIASLRKGSVTSPTYTIVILHWLKMHCIPHKSVFVF